MGPQGLGLEITELRLGLPGIGSGGGGWNEKIDKKRVFSGIDGNGGREVEVSGGGGCKNRNMDLIVGWPPVCLYRKKSIVDIKNYVKVSMDGTPILRKVDLSCLKGYLDLGIALDKLFNCYGIGEAIMNEESESCEYVAIYEDKDGDWMLVGDVPWLMFIETCKRLRIKRNLGAKPLGLHADDTFNKD